MQNQRAAHAPYLADLAPELDGTRIRIPLESFHWRIETDDDRRDFAAILAGKGSWERVKVPHFGPPMGRVATYYRTQFDVTEEMLGRGALFVNFKGVDYKANVYVNGALVGSHEGAFAPFEFEFTQHARLGKNVLTVQVRNDFVMQGNNAMGGFQQGGRFHGPKIYAAVGPGWDEPEVGWHHCPPGMGIYQNVTIEARRRMHLHDIFVRPNPEEGKAEAWIEVFGCDVETQPIALELSVFGQNFQQTLFQGTIYAKQGVKIAGAKKFHHRSDFQVGPGPNLFKIPLKIPQPRLWSPQTPWLYQIQVRLRDAQGELLDAAKKQFGMRSFRMDYAGKPKGRMYLNGRGIKLRGANTMGALQQCVMRGDTKQLIDDILLAKITNMNFMRLTQMPVQSEIYEYCDRLGLMVQTDLPLFGLVRRGQFCEVIRQCEEMERLVRAHPSNIMVTYINEPYRQDEQWNYHRSEMRPAMFMAADMVVRLNNPDRVIKAVDGDYSPPGPGMPDNHCYCGWYNGHGVDLGLLHKGYWQHVKPGWVYGCGEFGAEGLDPVSLMRKHYPKHWLPQTSEEEKDWTPSRITSAQTGVKHQYWFD